MVRRTAATTAAKVGGILSLVLLANSVGAYPNVYPLHRWPLDAVTFNIPPNRFPDLTLRYNSILKAIRSWDGATVPGCRFTTNPSVATRHTQTPVLVQGDARNSITDGSIFDELSLAVTFKAGTPPGAPGPYWWTEMDIVVNTLYSFDDDFNSVDTTPSGSEPTIFYSRYSFEGVVRHEIGHAVGFWDHENSQIAVMVPKYSYGGARDIWMHGDDRNALRTYYPSGPEPPSGWETDLQLFGWKQNGVGGSGKGDRLMPCTAPTPTSVPAGGQINVEYTVENLGTENPAFGSVNLGFYLSVNDTINNQDILIDNQTVNAPQPSTGGLITIPWRTGPPPRPVHVPCSTTPGTYYLGIILDYDHAIGESRENNNTLILPYEGNPQQITVTAPGPFCGQGAAPGPPVNFAASDNECACHLTWDPPTTGDTVESYTLFRVSGSNTIQIAAIYPPSTSYTDQPSPSTYTYYVRSGNQFGSANSNTDEGTAVLSTVPAPTGPSASTNLCDGIMLTWSYGGPDPDNFRVWRGQNSPGTLVASLPGSQRSWLDTSASGFKKERYQIEAVTNLCRTRSVQVEGRRWLSTFSAPSAVTVSASSCPVIGVSWSEPLTGAAQGFRVYRDGVNVFDRQWQFTQSTYSWQDTLANLDIPGRYYVEAYNPCGSMSSAEVAIPRAPVTYRITSNVPGSRAIDNGVSVIVTAPGYAVPCTTCTRSATRQLSVSPTQVVAGTKYCFDSWSDGEHRTHEVMLSSDSTITLTLVPSGSGPTTIAANAFLYDDALDCKSRTTLRAQLL